MMVWGDKFLETLATLSYSKIQGSTKHIQSKITMYTILKSIGTYNCPNVQKVFLIHHHKKMQCHGVWFSIEGKAIQNSELQSNSLLNTSVSTLELYIESSYLLKIAQLVLVRFYSRFLLGLKKIYTIPF